MFDKTNRDRRPEVGRDQSWTPVRTPQWGAYNYLPPKSMHERVLQILHAEPSKFIFE
jgi:hypothetical protein